MMLRFKYFLCSATLLLLLVGCSSKTYKDIDYLQNIVKDVNVQMTPAQGLIIQPKDLLSIVVTSNDPTLSTAFNITLKAFEAGSPSETIAQSYEKLLGYFVDDNGEIDFPVLGKIHVAGLNRSELQNLLCEELIEKGGVLEPHVIVEFLNAKISVLGEVKHPGQFSISNDKVNILQALSMAGDMTIYGRRDNVRVIREQNGNRRIYTLDVTSKDIFSSEGYYLQQDDIVYVCPSNVRAGQSTINENYVRSGAFILSLSSLAIVLANFLIKVF